MVSTTSTGLLTLPLSSGTYQLDSPVVLAPMAGITNAPFRMLCREQGAGLFVSEMVTARALLERIPETLRMIEPGPGEWPRSIQLYSVDPHHMSEAVKMIGRENLADHIDMNFGCPVPKVTRKGGGAALPYKRRLFSSIVEAAVNAAKPFGIPVTVKMRIGIDSDHITYLDAAKSAAVLGVAWVALHARTAAQMYEGKADWSAIAQLVEHLAPTGVPALGNGDIWSGSDGVAMMEQTGCAGVVVGGIDAAVAAQVERALGDRQLDCEVGGFTRIRIRDAQSRDVSGAVVSHRNCGEGNSVDGRVVDRGNVDVR